jgi:glucan 1,3-beta-glucosidase
MSGSSDIIIHGSALWVFFNKMNDNQWQDPQCTNTGGVCQHNMAFVSSASRTYWYGISTKSTANMVFDATNGNFEVRQDNNGGGWGGVVAAYLRDTA